MIYKIIKKILWYIHRQDVLSKINLNDSSFSKSIIIDEGVRILNPNVTVGRNVHLYNNVIIFGKGPVFIDDGSKIGFNTIIYSDKSAGIYIGKNCSIAANAYIIDTNHSTGKIIGNKMSLDGDISSPVHIGNNVWISAQCVIAKGAKLGDNVVVGANSFVNKEFAKNSIIGGSPARLIKYRGD